MATIYKFIIEETLKQQSDNVIANKPTTVKGSKPKKGISGSNKGVEHNRYMRAVNPVLNKYTGGYYEKVVRAGRAGTGVISQFKSGGFKTALTSVGSIILLQMAIMGMIKLLNYYQKKAEESNQANYLKMKYGQTRLSSSYSITQNVITGQITYGDNK